jgi:hypothetical protein
MAKTEVYSWRVDPEIKMGLEEEARRQGLTVSQLLDQITKHWLEERAGDRNDDEAEQARVHAAAAKCFGTIAAGPDFSENVGAKMRMLLKDRHARKRSA